MITLQNKELKRYQRQISLKEIQVGGQQKLKDAKVIVVGAGGLATPVLQYLCAAGVGTIGIADNDVVSESNLQRQVLYTTTDVNQPKTIIAAKRLKALNPFCNFNLYNERINSDNAESLIALYDIVVDCTDNFATRYLLDDVCMTLKKPLVYGSIQEFTGQVSVFHYKNDIAYRTLFPELPDESVLKGEPLGVMGATPGVIGLLQAFEVLKIITGIGDVLNGKLLMYDALKASFCTINFSE